MPQLIGSLLLDSAQFADRHGFSAVWTPERHLDAFGGPYPNPSVIAAALAMVTERVQLRAGSVVLPLHHPLRVAEEWAVVDALSGGRVGLSFASGWHADDFAIAPDPSVFDRRKEVMLERIETVRRLWRGEAVSLPNGVGREIEAHAYPRPVQPELPFWLTAAGNPATFVEAGRLGARLLTHLLGQSVDELAAKIVVYRQAWRAAGHPGEGHVSLMVHTYVGESAEGARAAVRAPFREYLRTSFGLVRALAPSLGFEGEPTAEDVDTLLDYAFEHYHDHGAMMGTAAQCLATADRLREAGVDELACLIDFGLPAGAVLGGLPRLDGVRERCLGVPAGPAGYDIAAQIARHGVTHLQCTPSLANVLVADAETGAALRGLRTILVGGEALPPALAADLAGGTGVRLVNMYGPTETTIWSTAWEVSDPAAGITIGRPIGNTTVFVLDERQRPVPVGVPGELYVGGLGTARGYLDRPGLTAQRFLPSPYGTGERMYRTGDRVRRLSDGRLEFLGRVDRQVKLGGHRLELGEIESVLRGHPAVQQAAVILHEDGNGRRLVGYLVGDQDAEVAELRRHLLRSLPEVMAPSTLVWLDELPLNTSGKLDYRALPAPGEVPAQRS